MATTFSDFLRGRVHELRQPAPILQFYDVTIPDSTHLRYVDFADRDAGGSLPTKVPFNGYEWDSVVIARGEIQESAEGSSFQLPVSVYDPTHAGAWYLRTHRGLTSQRVEFWIAAYDNLANPADAFRETFEIVSPSISQGPDTITIVLGHPNLYEIRVPKLPYLRRKCFNPYQDRFTVGNLCSYPSNEFTEKTQEDLLIDASWGYQARQHGWMTAQANRASTFDVHRTNSGDLTIATASAWIGWRGRERYGPAFFRPISGDFDLSTRVIVSGSRLLYMVGLFVHDGAAAVPPVAGLEDIPTYPASSWIVFGQQESSGATRLAVRKTVSGSSAPDVTVAVADTYLRMVRAGDVFTFYSKAAAGDAWTLRGTEALNLIPAEAYVGAILSSDDRSAVSLMARFEYLRFAAGGLASCKRTWEDCLAHGNMIDFNGFREMPSDRARY
jgi:hypothetical protein